MSFDYVLLKTDALLYLLLLFAFIYILYARKKEHLRTPWRQVARNKLGMMSAVILSFFLCIAVLDSIHFHPVLEKKSADAKTQYSTEIISLFDKIVEPLRLRVEKTYSAPFATHAYSKETIELGDGETKREYPRLKYGGAHLVDPGTDRTADIMKTTFIGLLKGLVICLVLIGIIVFLQAKRSKLGFKNRLNSILKGETAVPWLAIFSTFRYFSILQ